MKEAFVATLLELARGGDDSDDEAYDSAGEGDDDDPLDEYAFWRAFKAQVKILRGEMGSEKGVKSDAEPEQTYSAYEGSAPEYDEMEPLLDAFAPKNRIKQPGEAILPLAPGLGAALDVAGKGKARDYASLFAHVGSLSPADW